MRLHPGVSLGQRLVTAKEGLVLEDGRSIPCGSTVTFDVYAIHRLER
jgi:cytochrome P450